MTDVPLMEAPSDPVRAFALASALRGDGQLDAATAVMMALGSRHVADPDITFDCAQFMRECGRHEQAAMLCKQRLQTGSASPRMMAFAGNVAQELGQFEEAREHYMAALRAGVNLNQWFVLQSLANAQRYVDASHPDFALFESNLRHPFLTPRARASIMFALGKACDDVGDRARTVKLLREANSLARSTVTWSSATWAQFVAMQLRMPIAAPPPDIELNCTPVFVVGMVRSGTTLVADRIGRDPAVRSRGELPFIGYLAEQLIKHRCAGDPAALAEARKIYLTHLQQDDMPAGWYVDKHPLNFRYLGQIALLFPQARVIYCRRNRRDNALSIWSQLFAHSDNDYAYDFDDIAAFGAGCDLLMEHWEKRLSLRIHTVDYETMVEHPARTLSGIRAFLDLPLEAPSLQGNVAGARDQRDYPIASASMWQARQPVYRSSVARWKLYAALVPELVGKFADADS